MRPIFIGGCSRSGTTMLGALIGAHSRCVCVPEMPFKFNLLRASRTGSPLTTDSVRRILMRRGKFRQWGVPPRPLLEGGREPDGVLDDREAIEGLVRRYAVAVGRDDADVWVDHTPGNIRNVRSLLERFPDASLVHIVRDGRAVAASLLKLNWGPNSILAAASYWPEQLGYGLAAEQAYADRVVRVRYEDLLREPRETMLALCAKLGLDAEPQLGVETRFLIPRATMKQHSLVSKPPDPARAEAWRTTLTKRQIELFESRAGDLLHCMGYVPISDGSTAPARRHERATQAMRDVVLGVRGWAVEGRNLIRNRLRIGHPEAEGP